MIIGIIVSFIIGCLAALLVSNVRICSEKDKNSSLLTKISEQNMQIASLQAELKTRDDIKANEETIFNMIKKEFSLSANEILIEKQKNLQEQNKTSLESFLKPLNDRIKEFQAKVEEADKEGAKNAATIKEKVEDLVKQSQIACAQTEKLSNAISQNSKTRGLLGEMILDKLLKSSGLINKRENPARGNYETQVGFKDMSSGTKIVDAVVYLSEGQKSIVIDSKVSLPEFISFTQSEDEIEKQKHLNAFMEDVSNTVKDLSNKYTNLEGLNTPDFTIMFIPFELPLSYIYSNNKLIEDAIRQNVIIAGPSTLIAALRTINYSWSQKNQYENIRSIIKQAEGIYAKCVTFVGKLEEVQKSFETLRKKFDDAFSTIRGRGGMIGQVEKLKDFGLSPVKQIEEKYLEEEITIS